jgi:hypothetical protein
VAAYDGTGQSRPRPSLVYASLIRLSGAPLPVQEVNPPDTESELEKAFGWS